MIYMIGCNGLVKIGVSNRPWSRLADFQTGNPYPMEMLAIGPGDFGFESELHKLFGEHRGPGEWFQDNERIRAVVAFMRDTFPELQERRHVEVEVVDHPAQPCPIHDGSGRIEKNSDGRWRRRFQLKNPDGSPVIYTTPSGRVGYKRGSEYIRVDEAPVQEAPHATPS